MFWNNFWAVFGAMLPIFAACFVMLATATVICMSPCDLHEPARPTALRGALDAPG